LVTAVQFGGVTISEANLTRSEDGTTISFNAPAGTGKVSVVLAASSGDLSFQYTYKNLADPDLLLSFMNPDFGEKLSGQRVKMTASELKPGATYTLNMYSKKVAMVTGTVSPDGSINGSMLIPDKACVAPGLHKLILESVDESGKKHKSTVMMVLGSKCLLNATAEKVSNGTWKIRGIRFDYKKWDLTAETKATLVALKPWLKGAANINVSGYTETDGKGRALKVANKVLAKERALAIVNSFRSAGATNRFFIDPAGAKNPISNVQAKNRRVELSVRF
jgi:outer membrane protein OmpA-like peptidoglycan-associated protein